MKTLICALIGLMLALPCLAGDSFKDVPKDHWAAESVKIIAQNGIMKGYGDNTYRGDKPITRYELAITLERFIYFIQQSEKPISTDKSQPQKQSNNSSKVPAKDYLIKGGYVPADSTLFTKPDEPVTKEELAQVLSSVATKLIEQRVPTQSTAATSSSANKNSNSH